MQVFHWKEIQNCKSKQALCLLWAYSATIAVLVW